MNIGIFIFGLLILLVVALEDWKTKKIRNTWSLAILALVVIGIVLNPSFYLMPEHLLIPLVIFVSGFFLFRLKLLGGGDGKLLTAIFLLIPTEFQTVFLVSLAGCGLGYLISRRLYYLIFSNRQRSNQSRFSYAPVIFLALRIMGLYLWKKNHFHPVF